MSFIRSRLRHIESESRKSYRCPECALPPSASGRVVYSDSGDFLDKAKLDERCPGCGRRLWFVIEVSGAVGEGA